MPYFANFSGDGLRALNRVNFRLGIQFYVTLVSHPGGTMLKRADYTDGGSMSPNEYVVRPFKQGLLSDHMRLLLVALLAGPLLPIALLLFSFSLFIPKVTRWFTAKPGYGRHITYLPEASKPTGSRLFAVMLVYFVLPLSMIWGITVSTILWEAYLESLWIFLFALSTIMTMVMLPLGYLWLSGKLLFFRGDADSRIVTYQKEAFDSVLLDEEKKKAGVIKRNRPLVLLLLGFGPIFFLILPLGVSALLFLRFRRWFRQQPGYIHHISYLPGMRRTSKRRLILGMTLYFVVPVVVVWFGIYVLLYTVFFEQYLGTVMAITSPTAVVSLIVAYAWLTGKAGFFQKEMLAMEALETRARSLAGASTAARKANVERFLGFSSLTNLTNNQMRSALITHKMSSLPFLLWLPLIITIGPLLLFSYIFFGWIAGLIGAVLSFVPPYRRWLQRQPGTINRLAMVPGWLSANPFIVALAHIAYVALPSFILLIITDTIYLNTTEEDGPIYIALIALSPIVMPFVAGWFLRFWQIPVPGLRRLTNWNRGMRRWNRMVKTAVHHRESGQFTEGITLLKEALSYTQQKFGPNHHTRAKTYRDLGRLYLFKGEYAEAIDSYQQSINICMKGFGPIHRYTARSHYRLGKLYVHLGHFTQAIPHFKDAIHTYRILGAEKNPAYAQAFNDLGYAYLNLNHMEIAQALFEEAELMQREPFPADWTDTVNHLALLYTELENYEKADHFFTLLEEKADQVPHHVKSWIWINRARFYQLTGEYEAARHWQEKALENERSIYHDNHLTVGKYMRQLADILREMGQYERAQPLYIDAQGIYFLHGELYHPEYFNCLFGMAKLDAAIGQYHAAFEKLNTAVNEEEKIFAQTLAFGSENGRLAYLNSQYDKMVLLLELIRQHLSTDPDALLATDIILRRQSLIADMAGVLKQSRYANDPAIKRILSRLDALKEEIGRLEADGRRREEANEVYLRVRMEKYAEQERLETELSQMLPFDEALAQIGEATWTRLLETLPQDGLLMQFVYGKRYDFTAVPANGEEAWSEPGYLLLTLSHRAKIPTLHDLSNADELNKAVKGTRLAIDNMRKAVSAGRTQLEEDPLTAYGRQLHQLLIQPIADKVAQANHLFIVPDGVLTSLPFEIIPFEDRYLLDEYQISYLSTGRDLMRGYTIANQTNPLIVADPDYNLYQNKISKDGITSVRDMTIEEPLSPEEETAVDELVEAAPYLTRSGDRGSFYFSDLANTHTEGLEIAKLFDVAPHLEADANEQIIKNSHSPKVLHIATHGFFLEKRERLETAVHNRLTFLQQKRNPLVRAGLALAGANRWLRKDDTSTGNENGILNGLDVAGLDLSGTELVVLSACDTALGDYVDGEGVFGLRRAFVMAGAHTLVMSMWKVPDAQTQELMVEFYNELLAGVPRATALSNAQLKIKQNPKTAHPYFWGAFICQGAFGKLEDREILATD